MGERIPQGLRLACCTRNRRDETVAAARHVRHIACAARSLLPKRLAQRRDMKAKAALIDHKIRPDFCDQLLLADHFGWALDESDQNVESSAAKPNPNAVFFQESLCGG